LKQLLKAQKLTIQENAAKLSLNQLPTIWNRRKWDMFRKFNDNLQLNPIINYVLRLLKWLVLKRRHRIKF